MRYAISIAAVLLAVSCGPTETDYSQSGPSKSSTVAGTAGATETSVVAPVVPLEMDNPAAQPTPAGAAHEVHLIEHQIHMPRSVPAGQVTFRIENGGKEDHAFEIEGNGVHRATEVLKPGNSTSMIVDLRPGTYTVYCPVGNHADKGMKTTLQVQ